MRLSGTSTLGVLAIIYSSENAASPFHNLTTTLTSSSIAVERQAGALIIQSWAPKTGKDDLIAHLMPTLSTKATETGLYAELNVLLARMQAQIQELQTQFANAGHPDPPSIPSICTPDDPAIASSPLRTAAFIATTAFATLESAMPLTRTGLQNTSRIQAQTRLLESIGYLQTLQDKFHLGVQVTFAAAALALGHLPPKLNPLVKALVSGIKKLDIPLLQDHAADSLASLVMATLPRAPKGPNKKILSSLAKALLTDITRTPDPAWAPVVDTLNPLALPRDLKSWSDVKQAIEADQASVTKAVGASRGARAFWKALATRFGDNLFTSLPTLWTDLIHLEGLDDPGKIIARLGLVSALAEHVTRAPLKRLIAMLGPMFAAASHENAGVRYAVAGAVARLGAADPLNVTCAVITSVVPLLDHGGDAVVRLGAAEIVDALVSTLGNSVLPYLVFFLVPVLGRMSDTVEAVRSRMARTFGALIQLMPLEEREPNPDGMDESLKAARVEKRSFLTQLLDPSKLEPYGIPFEVKGGITLRGYQQDGVNWLAFLRRYGLHGVLCDDMGLGKTLQTLISVAGGVADARRAREAGQGGKLLPALIVAPTTLVEHWKEEIQRYLPEGLLTPIVYRGARDARLARVGKYVANMDGVQVDGRKLVAPPALEWRPDLEDRVAAGEPIPVVILSYEVLRNDVALFSSLPFGYCVLDEGHIIKNPKSKISQAVKSISAYHRLILTGTPIQNNVLELWSLFDFLMPGFLWDEKRFDAVYGKPIRASREEDAGERVLEAGALALEELHRQVLPFLMRRLKEEVLNELPPKIVQDVHVQLTPLQVELYEAAAEAGKGAGASGGKMHIFQTLQYLRKVINHPVLALEKHGMKEEVEARFAGKPGRGLHGLDQAPKLRALKELLEQCGIGSESGAVGGGHRVLVFAQSSKFLDLVEKDVFDAQMPKVTYMRLDGSVPAGSRQAVVSKFNADPTIDVLLLTTSVGGLGLNLTGADTVVFLDHDWNPMKDLQAMDRAHRLGQKRVVNVYRMIAKGTLEDKIMGLQVFKLNVANTIVSSENSSMMGMRTGRLVDLFELDAGDDGKKGGGGDEHLGLEEGVGASGGGGGGSGGGKLAKVLEGMGELWGEEQYQDEFDLGEFLDSIPREEEDAE